MGGKTYKVIWSKAAYDDYERVLEYLLQFWNQKTAIDFIDKIEHEQNLLLLEPQLGRASEKDPTIRSVLVTVRNRLYYSILDDYIHILRLYDTRQNPPEKYF